MRQQCAGKYKCCIILTSDSSSRGTHRCAAGAVLYTCRHIYQFQRSKSRLAFFHFYRQFTSQFDGRPSYFRLFSILKTDHFTVSSCHEGEKSVIMSKAKKVSMLRKDMSTPGLPLVYTHIRHSFLYLFWAVFYLYLTFIQQPILFFTTRTCDYFWLRTPFRGARDRGVNLCKRALVAISPRLARHFWARVPFGKYIGNDRALLTGEKKQLPLHSVSLNGCAWMLPYHIAVCQVLKQSGVVDDNTIWLGSSGGALIAATSALNLDLDYQLKFCLSMGIEARDNHALGPAGNMSKYIGPHLRASLPAEAHKLATGKLHISVTETPQGGAIFGNVLVSRFRSVQHLFWTLMSSTYIPLYYEVPVRPGIGTFYWDGGFSCNQPVLYGKDGRCLTTTVSPMARKADISPQQQTTCNIEHLFPGGYEEAMQVYENGRRDAESYVAKVAGGQRKYD